MLFRSFSNVSKCIQTHPDTSEHIRTHPKRSRQVPTSPKTKTTSENLINLSRDFWFSLITARNSEPPKVVSPLYVEKRAENGAAARPLFPVAGEGWGGGGGSPRPIHLLILNLRRICLSEFSRFSELSRFSGFSRFDSIRFNSIQFDSIRLNSIL